MSAAKLRTTIYLPDDLRWELKRVMAARRIGSDTKAVEEAVRQWVREKPDTPAPPVISSKDPWLQALGFILGSSDKNAISAVQQNILIFFERVGGNPNELPKVAEPLRGFAEPADRKKISSHR